jgi:hypothetical protein
VVTLLGQIQIEDEPSDSPKFRVDVAYERVEHRSFIEGIILVRFDEEELT